MNSRNENQLPEYMNLLPELDVAFTTCASQDNKETLPSKVEPSDNGAIFGYLALPPLFFLTILYVIHLVVFFHVRLFNFFGVEYLVGIKDLPQEGKAERALLWAHAFAAILSMVFMTFQLVSGLSLSLSNKKDETRVRQGHRLMGRFVAVLWTLVIVMGYVAFYRPRLDVSSDAGYKQRQPVFGSMIQFAGVSMIVNLWNGIRAVSGPKESRDYILHKGSMYFTFVGVAFSTGAPALSVNTIMALVPDCRVQEPLRLFLIALFYSLQVLGSWLAGCRWGGTVFRRPFVKYNFYFLVINAFVMWGALIYLIVNIPSPDEESCFADGFF